MAVNNRLYGMGVAANTATGLIVALLTACSTTPPPAGSPPASVKAATTTEEAATPVNPPSVTQTFSQWLDGVTEKALAQGISSATIEAAFAGLTPIPRVIELDRAQPEFTLTFAAYLDRMINDARISNGRKALQEHGQLIDRVNRRYGVSGAFLVAFWGLETNFGAHATGYFPVIGALATLGYQGRRETWATQQLLLALKIVDQGHIPLARLKGSWAGAMGHFQFIPSTFDGYTIDGDGDGRRDILGNLPDAFHSAANFLRGIGWQPGQIWGLEVALPENFDYLDSGLDKPRSVAHWQQRGVTPRGRQVASLPTTAGQGAIILPAGHRGPAFLVFNNFRVIMRWNNSLYYALAVAHLADRIRGGAPLSSTGPDGQSALKRAEIADLQRRLNALGFAVGSADGLIGPMTKGGIAAFQSRVGLVPDGYPDGELLRRIRAADIGVSQHNQPKNP